MPLLAAAVLGCFFCLFLAFLGGFWWVLAGFVVAIVISLLLRVTQTNITLAQPHWETWPKALNKRGGASVEGTSSTYISSSFPVSSSCFSFSFFLWVGVAKTSGVERWSSLGSGLIHLDRKIQFGKCRETEEIFWVYFRGSQIRLGDWAIGLLPLKYLIGI